MGGGPRVRYYSNPERVSWARDGVHYVMSVDGDRVSQLGGRLKIDRAAGRQRLVRIRLRVA